MNIILALAFVFDFFERGYFFTEIDGKKVLDTNASANVPRTIKNLCKKGVSEITTQKHKHQKTLQQAGFSAENTKHYYDKFVRYQVKKVRAEPKGQIGKAKIGKVKGHIWLNQKPLTANDFLKKIKKNKYGESEKGFIPELLNEAITNIVLSMAYMQELEAACVKYHELTGEDFNYKARMEHHFKTLELYKPEKYGEKNPFAEFLIKNLTY